MSWLFIDTSRADQFRVGRLGDRIFVKTIQGRSHQLLPAIFNIRATRYEGICVVSGPGSFSAIRTGTLIANLLARLWKIPLVGVSVEEAFNLAGLTERLVLGKLKSSTYVAPVYDMEPNITMKAS